MGRDRQEKKLRESGKVESDRDVGLRYKGATKMSSSEEARRLNDGKNQTGKFIEVALQVTPSSQTKELEEIYGEKGENFTGPLVYQDELSSIERD